MAQQKVYRTANGKIIDIELIKKKHELTPAVGNARVNARGDLLGPGGKIIRSREELLKDFYSPAEEKAKISKQHHEPKLQDQVQPVQEPVIEEQEPAKRKASKKEE